MERAAASCDSGATICTWVYDATGSRRLGEFAEVIVGTPLRILLVVLVALLLRYVLHRLIERTAEKIARGQAGLGRLDERLPSATAILAASPLTSARRAQRARTLASVLKSLTTGFIGVLVALVVLGELGINIGPLIAGAGIAGVAIGIGAQSLVKDFISGIFMVIEDQYGVGDVVDLGEAIGTVEAVGLRVSRVRDVDGTVWYVRNGEVLRVGNRSQGWARALLDVQVPYSQDLEQVREIMMDEAEGMRRDPAWARLLLDEPGIWAIEGMGLDAVAVRLIVKTEPLQQWDVGRELRSRIMRRFAAEGIDIALPYRVPPTAPPPAPSSPR